MTDEIEQGARLYIDRIDAMGGTLAAIEQGFQQHEIQNAAYQYQRAVETGQAIVVGVNRFRQEDELPPQTFRLDGEIEKAQIARLRELRATRSPVEAKLDALEQTAKSSDNLMPRILDACESHATVGEISNRLRNVFGEYREP